MTDQSIKNASLLSRIKTPAYYAALFCAAVVIEFVLFECVYHLWGRFDGDPLAAAKKVVFCILAVGASAITIKRKEAA